MRRPACSWVSQLFCLVANGLVYESVYEAGSGNGSGRDRSRIVDHGVAQRGSPRAGGRLHDRCRYTPDPDRSRSRRLKGATLEEGAWEVSVTTNRADYQAQPPDRGSVSVEELARRQGVRPVESVEDMARPGVFESDEELEEFLAHVYAARRADLA